MKAGRREGEGGKEALLSIVLDARLVDGTTCGT
jgi:hypothetical protein